MRKLRLKPLKGRFWRHLVAILVQNNSNLKTKIDRFKQMDFRREWPSDVIVYTVHFLWLEIMLDVILAGAAVLTALNISCTGFQEVSGLVIKLLVSLHVTHICVESHSNDRGLKLSHTRDSRLMLTRCGVQAR